MSVEAPEEFEAIQAEVMGEGDGFQQEPKQPATPRAFIGSDQCGKMVGMLFEVVAGRAGEKWRLDAKESGALGEALDPVLAKYMPSADQAGEEVQLAIVALAVFLPRMMPGGEDGNA